MRAVNTLQVSPIQSVGKTIGWALRLIVLVVLYCILFALGGGLVALYLPTTHAEPGPVSEMTGLLIVGLALSVPQNIVRVLLNGVRMSHLIQTASSTFVFGPIVTWLLYSKYVSK